MSQQQSRTTQNSSLPVRNGTSNGLSNGHSNGTTNGQASASGNQGTGEATVFAAATVNEVNEHGQPLRVMFVNGRASKEVPDRLARTLRRAVSRSHGVIVTAEVSGETLVRWLDVEVDGGYNDQASPTGHQGTDRQTLPAAASVSIVGDNGAIEQVWPINGNAPVDIPLEAVQYFSERSSVHDTVIVILIKDQDHPVGTAAAVYPNSRVSR